MERPAKLIMENAQILYPNFGGQKGNYKGNRSFSILIPAERAEHLRELGWYVKHEDANEYHDERYYLQARIVYPEKNSKGFDPKIYMVTNGTLVNLNRDTVGMLDDIWIDSVDVILGSGKEPSMKPDGKLGFAAYCNVLYVKTNGRHKVSKSDPFAAKYEQLSQLDNPGLALDSDDLSF